MTWLTQAAIVLAGLGVLAWLRGGQRPSRAAALTAVVALAAAFSTWTIANGLGYLVAALLREPSGLDGGSGFSALSVAADDRSANTAVGLAVVVAGGAGLAFYVLLRARLKEASLLDGDIEGIVELFMLLGTTFLFLNLLVTVVSNVFLEVAKGDDFTGPRRPIAFAIASGLLWAGYLVSVLRRHGVSLRPRPEPAV